MRDTHAVMMPAVAQNRLYSLFFVSYLFLGLFFLLNLVLAVLYSNYKRQLQSLSTVFLESKQTCIRQAYLLLTAASDQKLSIAELVSMLMHLREETGPTPALSRYLRQLSVRPADSVVAFTEFEQAVLYLTLSSSLRPKPAGRVTRIVMQPVLRAVWLRRIVISPLFEVAMNLVALSNALLLVTYMSLGWQQHFSYFQFAFITVYWLEMTGKALVFGLKAYLRLWRNWFEVGANTVSLILVCYVFGDSDWTVFWQVITVLVFVRLARILVLLGSVVQYQRLYSTFLAMLPIFATELSTIIVTFYAFSMAGVSAFGGKIYSENQDIAADATVPLIYVYNNFNDFPSGLVTLFELLIVNNWWVIVEMYTNVSSKLARVFFIAFYALAVLICLNLMVALTLDVYNFHDPPARAMRKDTDQTST